MGTGCESGNGERSGGQIAVVDLQHDDILIAAVEIGMGLQEGFGLACRREAETIDIVMAVALGMRRAEQRAEREILLHAEAGLAGEILAGDEMRRALRAPRRG